MADTIQEQLKQYLAVKCSFCNAEPGQKCKDPETGAEQDWFHRGRAITAKGG
jgi:hypothetical protein